MRRGYVSPVELSQKCGVTHEKGDTPRGHSPASWIRDGILGWLGRGAGVVVLGSVAHSDRDRWPVTD